MSSKCKRCKYNKLSCMLIDYDRSAKEQKICWQENLTCFRCGHEHPRRHRDYKECNINEYPDYVNPDLTKIIHEHNYNENFYIYDQDTYDEKGNCVKLIKQHYYKCSFCGKPSDYVETIVYDMNNKCDKMDELTKKKKINIENEQIRKLHEDTGICPTTGNKYTLINKGWCNDRPYMNVEVTDIRCSECNCQIYYDYNDGRNSQSGQWWK